MITLNNSIHREKTLLADIELYASDNILQKLIQLSRGQYDLSKTSIHFNKKVY